MTEANLWPSWPSYQSHMYCLHRLGEFCTQFYEKTAIHFILLRLVQPAWVTVQRGMYTKSQDAWYGLYWLQSSASYARNSRKNNYALGQLSMDSKPYIKLAKGCLIYMSRIANNALLGVG